MIALYCIGAWLLIVSGVIRAIHLAMQTRDRHADLDDMAAGR